MRASSASPLLLSVKGLIELLGVLQPLQHEIGGCKAGDDPRGRPDDRVDVRIIPNVRERGQDGCEDHRHHAPAGAVKRLVVFSTPQKIARMKIHVKPDQTTPMIPMKPVMM